MRRLDRMRDDSGFSLSELIIVLGLLSMVLMGAWGGMFYVTKSNSVSTAQGNAAHDFSDPMEEMSRMIMQNLSIKAADPYRIDVWTDRNMDGAPELDAFYATTDNKLVYETWGYTSDRLTVTSHHLWVMSANNYNKTTNTPLFTYYKKDSSGNLVTIGVSDVAATAPSNAVRVRVQLKIDMGSGVTAADVRDIVFRNRS
jgi:prepilin-type N-terminal cleavage/methylation domain-containing protein